LQLLVVLLSGTSCCCRIPSTTSGTRPELSGILFARPGGDIPVERFDEYEKAILGVVVGEEGLDELPLITRMDFGHTDPMFVLSYSVETELACVEKWFSIVEGALVD
jgi:muramoyltetrapeptide carboxypeptidase LdcA involved in peptidoglycan recycling